jgi:hypothetical protein
MVTLSREQEIEAGRQAEFMLARRHFRYFLPFVNISVPGVGMVPIEQWDYVKEVVNDLETDRLLSRAKARQIGFSTILSAYSLWHAQFVPNAMVLDISKGEREAHAFLSKSRGTWQQLPPELQIPLATSEPNNREQMTFDNGGCIVALPSTTDAGRGLTPTLVIMDEADYHEYLDEAYLSVKPGLDTYNGQLIITSTVNAYKMGSLFQTIYQNAPMNGFSKRFYGWTVRPDRDESWYEIKKTEYDNQALFQKEYPATEEEAFAPAKAIAAFDLDALTMMKQDVRDPLMVKTMGNGVQANIYQEFQAGNRYAAATDTSHGAGRDYAVTVVYNTSTGYVVADIMSAVINASELGLASVELLNGYGSPIWGIEDNDWGVMTVAMAQELRYKRLYHQENGTVGWHTHDSMYHGKGSRYQVWGDMIEAINRRFFHIPHAEGLAQFFTVIRNPDKRGRIEAQQGAHDDYPMALAIAYQLKEYARPAAGDRGKDGDGFTTPSGRARSWRWTDW